MVGTTRKKGVATETDAQSAAWCMDDFGTAGRFAVGETFLEDILGLAAKICFQHVFVVPIKKNGCFAWHENGVRCCIVSIPFHVELL